MPVFSFRARKTDGTELSGERRAIDRLALQEALGRDGLLLIDARTARNLDFLRPRRSVKPQSMLRFLSAFRSLAAGGVPILQALDLLAHRPEEPALASALGELKSSIENGQSLADAMAEQPETFDPLLQATVRVGTITGNLDTALGRLERFLALRSELQRKLNQAMTYPIFLLLLLFVVLAGLMLFVLPRFAALYSELGSELPLLTRVLMLGVRSAPVWVPVACIGGFLGLFLFRQWARRPSVSLRLDRMKLSLPLFGAVQRDMVALQTATMLALLRQSGVTPKSAIGYITESLSNHHAAANMRTALADVEEGKSITSALEATNLFPSGSMALIAAGEASGDLERMFDVVADLHRGALEDRMARLTTLIEPAMMLLVGVVLGTVIIAVYLPIFGLSSIVN